MTTQSYDIGDNRRFSVNFTDIDADDADPTVATIIIKQPDGVDITYVYDTDVELVKDSVGNYHADFTFTQSGRHQVRFTGTGALTSAEQIDVYIRA